MVIQTTWIIGIKIKSNNLCVANSLFCIFRTFILTGICHLNFFCFYDPCGRKIEDSWLGSWRCLLLGERADAKNLDAILSKLSRCLKSECKLDANMSALQAIIGGSQSLCDIETCISQMVQYRGYLGRGRCCRQESFRVFSSAVDGGAETLPESTRGLILEAVSTTVQEPVDREPIVLVLDSDLQVDILVLLLGGLIIFSA